jgi:N-acetylglucosamine-6-sulfatase
MLSWIRSASTRAQVASLLRLADHTRPGRTMRVPRPRATAAVAAAAALLITAACGTESPVQSEQPPTDAQGSSARPVGAGVPGAPAMNAPQALTASKAATRKQPRRPRRPNIVFLMTDDQRLDDMRWMPKTRRLIGDRGITFTEAISPHPLCCPARAEVLTGKFAHNNGVRHNDGPRGGHRAFVQRHRNNHIGVWMQKAGYQTAFLGKYLNGYENYATVPPGWTRWAATTEGTYAYDKFKVRTNTGTDSYNIRHSRRHYVADVMGEYSRRYARQFTRTGKPFFMWVSHLAPHTAERNGAWGPPIPAPRHAKRFPRSVPPMLRQPHFLEADTLDKPAEVRLPKGKRAAKFPVKKMHRQRLRSLAAVDDANALLINTLDRLGVLENTLIVFASDNGYLLGEHGLITKNYPYEAAMRIPMLVRGPGIPAGKRMRHNITLVDLPSTFLAAAKAPRRRADGANLLPTLREGVGTSNTALIQAGQTSGAWLWRGVRTPRYTYTVWDNGDKELYDRRADPYQLRNLLGTGRLRDARYTRVLSDMQRRFRALRNCAGATQCQRRLGPDVSPARLPSQTRAAAAEQPTGEPATTSDSTEE